MAPVLATRTTWKRPTSPDTSDLTPEEVANAKRAIRVLRTRLGGNVPLAETLGVNAKTLALSLTKNRKPSVGLVLRAARLASVHLEDILSGAWPKAGSCPHCGRM